MTCKPEKTGPEDLEADCKCHAAVLRAYKGLLSAGTPECHALEAAKIIYSHHHPEDTKDVAALIVERWVYAEHVH